MVTGNNGFSWVIELRKGLNKESLLVYYLYKMNPYFMYVCMHVHMHIYVYVYTYLWHISPPLVCVCVYTYMYLHAVVCGDQRTSPWK